jgi:[ribosomal protein S5]-alanine N-acetyltransferase
MSIYQTFSVFPIIETPNLLLRQSRPDDAEALFAIFSDDAVVKDLDMLPMRTLDDAAVMLSELDRWYVNFQGIRWMITFKDEDVVIGTCGFHRFDAERRRAETGYDLRRDLWGHGIMREAMIGMLDYGFAVMDLHRVEAVVNDDNERSKRFLEKLGFTYEACLRRRFWFNGRYKDDHYFGLLRGEW